MLQRSVTNGRTLRSTQINAQVSSCGSPESRDTHFGSAPGEGLLAGNVTTPYSIHKSGSPVYRKLVSRTSRARVAKSGFGEHHSAYYLSNCRKAAEIPRFNARVQAAAWPSCLAVRQICSKYHGAHPSRIASS